MAATRTRSNRSLVSWALIVAGALVVIGALILLIAPTAPSSWAYGLGGLILAIAFVLIALTVSLPTLGTVAFWVGAVGGVLVVIAFFGSIPALLVIAGILAVVGSIVGGIVVLMRRPFSSTANVVFFIAMILLAIYSFRYVTPILTGTVDVVESLLFGAATLIAGLLILQKR